MASLNGFDATQHDPNVGFEPLPSGKYVAQIVESDIKATKAGTGSYLELVFEVVAGQYKGRKVWARLNIDNPSAQAVAIGRGELSAICHAVGVLKPQDSCDLHNLPLCIKVTCKKREDNGEITNEVKGYEKKEAAFGIGTPQAPQPQAPPQQAASAGPAPWARQQQAPQQHAAGPTDGVDMPTNATGDIGPFRALHGGSTPQASAVGGGRRRHLNHTASPQTEDRQCATGETRSWTERRPTACPMTAGSACCTTPSRGRSGRRSFARAPYPTRTRH